MEIFEFTHSYYRFPDEVSNRLDALFNDTVFDILTNYQAASKYPFKELKEVVHFRKEKRNPLSEPDEDFLYTDIGSVDIVFGEASPSVISGGSATSSRMRQVMHKDDVLLSTTRPYRNAICIVSDEIDKQICSTGFAVLDSKAVTSKFLFLALRSKVGHLQLQKFCSGSGYPAINQENDVPVIKIPCPNSLDEQESICKAIEPLEKKAKELRLEATELQNEAVNYLLEKLHIDIPESLNYFFKSGKEKKSFSFFVPSDDVSGRLHYLNYHPKYKYIKEFQRKYRTVTLGSICKRDICPGVQPYFVEQGERMALKTVDLKNKYIDYNNALRVTAEFFNENEFAQVQKGDIIIAATGFVSMGKVDVFEHDTPALISGELLSLRVNEHYDPYFIAFFLRSHLGQIQIEKYWTGSSGQIHLYDKDVTNFVVPSDESVPKELQIEISKEIKKNLERAISLEDQARTILVEAEEVFERLVFGG